MATTSNKAVAAEGKRDAIDLAVTVHQYATGLPARPETRKMIKAGTLGITVAQRQSRSPRDRRDLA